MAWPHATSDVISRNHNYLTKMCLKDEQTATENGMS